MIKTLPTILNEDEIQYLVQYFIFDDKNCDVTDTLNKMTRHLSYQTRKYSHSVTAKTTKFDESDFEKAVWNYYIHKQIQEGRTTGQLAAELEKDLEFLNSFF